MKSNLKTLTVLVTALLAMSLTAAKAEKVLRPKLNDIKLWNDEKFVTHDIKLDSNDPHINFTLNVVQQLHHVDLHIEATLVKKQNPDYFISVNTTLNWCNILEYTAKSPLAALLNNYLKHYGHILEKCPIVKGRYYLRNFWIPEDTSFAQFADIEFVILFKAIHVDASKQKTVIINDNFAGELVVFDAKNIKSGLLALFPKTF